MKSVFVYYRNSSREELRVSHISMLAMRAFPFATLISVVEGEPFISHLPLDRAGVLEGLRARTDDNSRLVLGEMLKIYAEDGWTLDL